MIILFSVDKVDTGERSFMPVESLRTKNTLFLSEKRKFEDAGKPCTSPKASRMHCLLKVSVKKRVLERTGDRSGKVNLFG